MQAARDVNRTGCKKGRHRHIPRRTTYAFRLTHSSIYLLTRNADVWHHTF
jgi:hypothetical protein